MTATAVWDRTWGPPRSSLALGGVVVLLGLLAFVVTDVAGRLLVAVFLLGAVAALVRALVLSPVLAVGPHGWRVVSGVTVHELEWAALTGATVRRKRGRTLELEVLLDGDDEPTLVVLGRPSLGAEPSAVLPVLLAARAASPAGPLPA